MAEFTFDDIHLFPEVNMENVCVYSFAKLVTFTHLLFLNRRIPLSALKYFSAFKPIYERGKKSDGQKNDPSSFFSSPGGFIKNKKLDFRETEPLNPQKSIQCYYPTREETMKLISIDEVPPVGFD